MVRSTTRAAVRGSPARQGKGGGGRYKSATKFPRSPLSVRSPLKPATPPAASRRNVLGSKSKLYTIQEEAPDVEAASSGGNYSMDLSILRDLDLGDVKENISEGSSDVDSDFEGWDDETTLVAKIQDNIPEMTEREHLTNLAHSLEGPMAARGALLKQYLAHTVAPAAKKVKEVHTLLEQKVDVAFGVGVLSFDDACKRMEKMSLRDEDELKNVFRESQRNLRNLFSQLHEAYQKREQLWNNLNDTVDERVRLSTEALAALPMELEDTVTAVEKKAKELSKSSALDGKAKQKILRELLAEI